MKDIVKQRYEADELLILRELAALGSHLAKIKIELRLTREIVAAAMAILRYNGKAWATLASILGETRFKRALHGKLLATRCPHFRNGKFRGGEDSFAHLVGCYNLRGKLRRGMGAIDFPIEMARKTIDS